MQPRVSWPRLAGRVATVAAVFGLATALSAQNGFITGDITIQGALYPVNGGIDWVKSTTGTPNFQGTAGVDCYRVQGQVCGVRIADHVGNSNRDAHMFLTGGKLEDASTWNVGPGTLGSAKYNCTQAYLANNQRNIYFAMERQGNDGTTAFDFEFNKQGAVGGFKPTRQVGDVLFTFEVKGSGNTGSVTPYVFVWNGSSFVNKTAASARGATNNAATKPAPWGYVNSKNQWVISPNIPNFQFAEAGLSLAEAFGPDFDPCNSFAYVQIRTRSSAVVTSDLKDTTPIFRYEFGGPNAVAAVSADVCDPIFIFDGRQSADADGKTFAQGADLDFDWQFTVNPTNVTLSGTGLSGGSGLYTSKAPNGTVTATLPAGVNSATVTAKLVVTSGTICQDDAEPITVTVRRTLTAAITKKEAIGSTMVVKLTGTAPAADRVQWQVLKGTTWTNIGGAINVSGDPSGTNVLEYSGFEADTSPVVQGFNIDGVPYHGKIWKVKIRLRAMRLDASGNVVCTAESAPADIAKVVAVDP